MSAGLGAGSSTGATGTLSLDLDDAWAYLRTRGDSDWASAPSVLPLAAERLLPLLAGAGLRLTVFVVGRDASRPEGREAVRAFADAGHEIACHSDLHRGELASMPRARVHEDVARATGAIGDLVGIAPRGFRCPSFGTSEALLEVLADLGYAYDASVLPTSLGPLLRGYYRLRVRRPGARGATGADGDGALDPSAALFGPASNALRPLVPFRWQLPARDGGDVDGGDAGAPPRTLLELPVSTVPLLRAPVHMSYLQALAGLPGAGAAVGRPLARGYLSAASALWRLRSVPPSFLLHPTDLVDARDAPRLGFFPGTATPWQRKVEAVAEALAVLARGRAVGPLGDAADALDAAGAPALASAAAPGADR